jgi:hypothetical protein
MGAASFSLAEDEVLTGFISPRISTLKAFFRTSH